MKKLFTRLKSIFSNQANLRYVTLFVSSIACIFVMSKIVSAETKHKPLITFFVILIFILINSIAYLAIKMFFRREGGIAADSAAKEYLYIAANNVSYPIAVFGTLTGEYRASNKAFRLMKKKNGIRGKLFS